MSRFSAFFPCQKQDKTRRKQDDTHASRHDTHASRHDTHASRHDTHASRHDTHVSPHDTHVSSAQIPAFWGGQLNGIGAAGMQCRAVVMGRILARDHSLASSQTSRRRLAMTPQAWAKYQCQSHARIFKGTTNDFSSRFELTTGLTGKTFACR